MTSFYRWIIVLALGPRALRNAWHVFVWLGMVVIVLYTVAANACSDTPSGVALAAPSVDVATIASMTAKLAPAVLEYGPPPAAPVCFVSDVKSLCCPSACAVKRSPKWETADRVLRSCMAGIGCSDSESKGATVGMRCDCGKAKP